MATNKLNDGVGKKIVEALKMNVAEEAQDHFDNVDETNSLSEDLSDNSFNNEFDNVNEQSFVQTPISTPQFESEPPSLSEVSPQISDMQVQIQSQLQEQATRDHFRSAMNNIPTPMNIIDNAFANSLAQNLGANSFNQVQDDFNYPANVAVLKQLIAKLPSGVSRQTGAIIIKQTMEALGISMQSVMQEARQVQETFVNNANECQNNIVEYRKQINILEAKSQQYQRQASVMNDIISLFINS